MKNKQKSTAENSRKKTLLYYTTIISLFICIIIIFTFNFFNQQKFQNEILLYIKQVSLIEREFIENIPIYDDFATPAKEKKLREFLLRHHLKAAEKSGISAIKNDSQIQVCEQNGKLVKLKSSVDELYYFYNVPDKYRYLTPHAAHGLKLLTQRLQENIKKKNNLPAVKIAVSSAIRPVIYQKKLKKKNINAAIVSSHGYGISFDIFYDDFYVSLPEPLELEKTSRIVISRLKQKFGFMLGDSLRRQFRSVLVETLLQAQEEGLLYVIHEKKQRCYHVTILK